MMKPTGTEDLSLAELEMGDLDHQFSVDTLDDWTALSGLAETAVKMVSGVLTHAECRLFVHVGEAREFREVDREGVASIPEDSLFLACLTMQNEALSLGRLFEELYIDDPLLWNLFQESYRAQWIIPLVHRFSLLAFFLVSFDEARRPGDARTVPTAEESRRLAPLLSRLKVNLYAARVADARQRSLLTLAELPQTLRSCRNIAELLTRIPLIIKPNLPFDQAVYYEYDEYQKLLIPRSWEGVSETPAVLVPGQGLSGFVFDRGRAVAVPDRRQHAAFASIEGEDFIEGSFVAAPVVTDGKFYGVLILGRRSTCPESYSVEHRYTLEIAVSFIAHEIDSRLIHMELEQSYLSTITSLVRALEAKDPYTRGHSERVMEISVGIAHALALSPHSIRKIRYAAILHDIGKIGIQDSIILKEASLSAEEFQTIKKHPQIGFDIIDSSGFLGELRELVRYHHEKLDGSGYYGKLCGDYPWEDQIISLADIYDALTSDRPYRKALTREQAVEALVSQVGLHFSQGILDAFLEWLDSSDLD